MHREVIADTSCLIVLTKIGELDLLNKLYGVITITNEIAEEFDEPLPLWIEIKNVTDKLRQKILELQIDKGEASAIALSIEKSNCLLIIDDDKARKVAKKLDITITGTIGVIVKAKQNGIISSIKPILKK